MVKRLLIAGALVFAAGCGSHSSPTVEKTVTVTPSPSVSFDAWARQACQAAAQDAWLAALDMAKLSLVRDLEDTALREEQLGNHNLVKQWCQQHYRG